MTQDELSPRVKAVADAVSQALNVAAEYRDEAPPAMQVVQHNQTKKLGVVFQQSDDPEDALILCDQGLSTLGNSTCLPWTEDQGEAFFAALITMFTLTPEALLEPPSCPDCEAENN